MSEFFLGLLLIVGWFVTLIGLPGNWLMVVAMAAYAYFFLPQHGSGSWSYVVAAVILALVGELVEFAASAAGMAKGGSKRGAVLAMLGAIAGSIVGAAIGLPIPIIGSVVGMIICSGLGAMAGAMLGELWKGRPLGHSVSIGKAAFWGRLLGTGAKLICGGVIVGTGVAMIVAVLS